MTDHGPPHDDVEAVDVVVDGRVQGVWFRSSTREEASRLGVAGWVRNEPDGTVRAHLEGPAPSVDTLLDWIREGGPPRARVTSVEVTAAAARGLRDFRIV
jgi:acylphosphatase